jgi:manganese/zinc/iron transport system permease protein
MVISASVLFGAAFLFAPSHGVLSRWWRNRSVAGRIRRENTLKALYQILEQRGFHGDQNSLRELAERRRETIEEAEAEARTLARHRLATMNEAGDGLSLTPAGWQRACEIVRNHRLWELYLTAQARIATDHVHEDAERIEHILGEETVRELERKLNFANRDPHGRLIPSLQDIQAGAGLGARR